MAIIKINVDLIDTSAALIPLSYKGSLGVFVIISNQGMPPKLMDTAVEVSKGMITSMNS